MHIFNWVKQHQDNLRAVYQHERDQLTLATECYNQQITLPVNQPLALDTLVHRKNHPLGHHKIQDHCDPTAYQVQEALDQDGRVDMISLLDGPER